MADDLRVLIDRLNHAIKDDNAGGERETVRDAVRGLEARIAAVEENIRAGRDAIRSRQQSLPPSA